METLETLITRYPDLTPCQPQIASAFELLVASFQGGGKLLVCGNGGSAADSEHIVGELMKGFMLRRPVPADVRARLVAANPADGAYLADHLQGALPAISLVSQASLISAFANDVAADMAYAQQVFGYGRPGDVVWGISTSGNARNVIHALQVGRALRLRTVGLTGRSGGAMLPCCDVAIRVPSDCTPDIQERHLAIYHAVCVMVEQEFFTQ
jgi:D-sedoheptulose 7-phosphate isomerase